MLECLAKGEKHWIQVSPDTEYTLNVEMLRTNRFERGKHDNSAAGKAFTPRFPKPKDEGWFLVLGDVEEKDLVAMKRAMIQKNRSTASGHAVTFFTPVQEGKVIYTLYIMSDCYLGLDQQYEIYLEVVPNDEDDVSAFFK